MARRLSSTCQIDLDKAPRHHRCNRQHEEQVEEYRTWRDLLYEEAEQASIGYATELDEFWQTHQRPTFGHWLTMGARHEH